MIRRFQKRIYISLPETNARSGIVMNSVKEKTSYEITDDEFLKIGEATDGFSGSDL